MKKIDFITYIFLILIFIFVFIFSSINIINYIDLVENYDYYKKVRNKLVEDNKDLRNNLENLENKNIHSLKFINLKRNNNEKFIIYKNIETKIVKKEFENKNKLIIIYFLFGCTIILFLIFDFINLLSEYTLEYSNEKKKKFKYYRGNLN